MRQLQPALQYSEGRSKPWSGASLVNAFSEKGDGDKVVDFAVMAIPGLLRLANVGTEYIRGAHFFDNLLYVVAGASLFAVNPDGSFVEYSSIAIGGAGPVTMDDNGAQIAICGAPNGYVFDAGVVYQPADLPAVSDVAYIDGYMVWTVFNSDQFIYSAINDALSYDALDVATVEGAPDDLVGLVNNHRELLFFGTRTIEIWFNSGSADNVFQRQGNAFIERGCFDRNSIIKCDNSVFFLGDDRIIYRLDGYTPVRVSTHAIEYKIRNCTYAFGFTYTQEGHKFYGVTTSSCTMLYDMATGAWHERKSKNRTNWRVTQCTNAWGFPVLCDAYTGNIYRADFDVYTEDGEEISVEITLPTIDSGRRDRLTMYAFEVYCETGVGSSGQAPPQIMLSYSDNGGRTWSNELWRSLGAVGDYLHRAMWRALGQFRQRDIRLQITDPVRRFVISYWADVR